MKLVAFDTPAGGRIGQITGTRVRDVASLEEFYDDPGAFLIDSDALADASEASALDLADLRQVPPVPETARIFCVGINYASHVKEAEAAGLAQPEEPMIFGRWRSTLVTTNESVPVPPKEDGLDWEAELAVVIGRQTWCASKENAWASVLGYTGFNDLSARKKQADTAQWTLGKNADRSGPIGPVLVTMDEIGGPPALEFSTRVNGEIRQQANTAHMVHDIAELIAYISDTVTLMPGDVIATGTTGGVGAAMTPPQLLQPGDTVEVEFEAIGVLRTSIVGPDEFRPAGTAPQA